MITLDALREACNEACTCGGGGPGQPGTCPACEVWHALKGAEAGDDAIGLILDALFTNGSGEKADRLVLVQDRAEPSGVVPVRNLGGWSRAGVKDQIVRRL